MDVDSPDQEASQPEKPALIAACIFIPFPGFPPASTPPQPLDSTEKLRKIIENVKSQQNVVKSNIMSIFEQQADALSDTARRKADRIADDSGLCGDDPLEHVKQEKAVADMVQRMRGSSKLYEERVRAEEKQKSRRKSLPEFGLDASEVEMSGINTTLPSNPNTARKVYQDLSKDLRALVDTGTSQLENYDTHSKQVVSFYQSALDRRGSNASLTSLTTHGRTGSVASIDLNPSNSTRRTSTAPVESALDFARRISAAPKKRDSGVDEDRARRGSRG